MLQKLKVLEWSDTLPLSTKTHTIDYDGERRETTKAGERDFVFSILGTAGAFIARK